MLEVLEREFQGEENQHEIEALKAVVTDVLHLEGVTVEICGTWVWVSGQTYPHRETLKDLGFQYSRTKKMWYWAPVKRKRKLRVSVPMERVRFKYGSIVLNGQDQE